MFTRANGPQQARSIRSGWLTSAWAVVLLVVLLGSVLATVARAGQPFIWDDDDDGLDDRMETVNVSGYQFSFTANDSLLPQRFQVLRVSGQLVYGVYILFKAPVTNTDLAMVTGLGMPVLHRFEGVAAVRTLATFAQAQAVKEFSTVERVEVIPLLYSQTREDLGSIGAVDPSDAVFPTWAAMGGGAGHDVVVAILDTGINDDVDGSYPGHESLLGRRVGGATFTSGDSLLDTPPDGSTDPVDHGGAVTHEHGTHVAGIVLGSGGASGYAPGVAPQAEFVDVKVLGDTGFGTGIAEALDWCIHNRSRDWGGSAQGHGIQVINLSASSLDESDGNDVPAALAARAAQLGMVVVTSVGNDGEDHHIPSPAAGDGVIAVGAYDAQRTPAAGDDQFASFSDRGPRAGDGDLDPADEQKPDLVAPGMAVLSADGDPSSDGTHYKRLSGTSMSAAVVSGAVAALRSEFPSLAPSEIATVLRATARRDIAEVPAGPAGVDPRWQAAIGWGAIDLYAARLELLQPERTQVRRLALQSGVSSVTATVWTQRERDVSHLVLERAPDVEGAPGAWAPVDSVAAAGDSSLATSNLTAYALTLAVPEAERGVAFWYRVSTTENGVRHDTPAVRHASPAVPSVATVLVRIVHDAYDHDIDASVRVGGSSNLLRFGPGAHQTTSLTFPLPGTSASVSSDWVSGTSATGTVAWEFALEIPPGAADEYLPPTSAHPWVLVVTDGGYANRSGRVENYQLVWHSPQGDQTFAGFPLPRPTVEEQSAVIVIPTGTTGVDAPADSRAFRAGPSPARIGQSVAMSVSFADAGRDPGDAVICDLSGRVVARVPFTPAGDHWAARWSTSEGRPGVYFARAGAHSTRLVLIPR